MDPFTTHTGIVALLKRANVDTDANIPKQFLKSIRRTGYGPNAFFDWRYQSDGSPDPAFELNHPRFEGRSILVAGNNFGCGSSREHAVWALVQDGYRVIIAPWKIRNGQRLPGFADIFKANAAVNGLLTVELAPEAVEEIFALADGQPGLEATVDLPQQTVTVHASEPKTYAFDMEAGAKERLLQGLDDISLTLRHEAEIAAFEKTHETWLGAPG
jgi:3-isopropylmalate/(R)-2-methylmalate dehydratase small subunit